MSVIRELIVRIKTRFNDSEFGKQMEHIKKTVNSIQNPNIKAKLNETEIGKSINNVKQGLKSITSPEIKPVVDESNIKQAVKDATQAGKEISSALDGHFTDKSGRLRAKNGRYLTMQEKQELLGLGQDAPKIKPLIDLSSFKQGLAQMKAGWKETKESMKGAFAKDIGGKFAGGVSTGETLVAGAGVTFAVKEAVNFETHMAGVIKQVNGMRDASGNLTAEYKDLEAQIKAVSAHSPISPNDTADIVTAGARMNVAKEDLIGFTETAIKMGTAFEAPAAEIADKMGQIANVFGIPNKSIGELAGAINYLDDNAISKGKDIIDVLQRVGGVAKASGISAQNITALGSTFLSMGKTPEVAGTAINGLITSLSLLDPKNKDTAETLKQLGLNGTQLKESFAKDANGAIMQVMESINKLDKSQRVAAAATLFGRYYGDDIVTVSGNLQEYRRQLELANSEKAKASLDAEYQNRLKTTSAQLEIFKNKMTLLAIEAGSVAIPALTKFLDSVSPIITAITNFAKENPKLVQTILAIVTAMAGMKLASMGLMTGVGVLGTTFSALVNVFKGLSVAVSVARVAFTLLAANPIIFAITGIITAVALLIIYWDTVKQKMLDFYDYAKSIWSDVKSFFGFSGGTVDINANKNVQLLAANPLGNTSQAQMMPQAVTNSYYQQSAQASTVTHDNKVTDNRVTNIHIAPNGSAQQAQEVTNILRDQNRQSLAIAGSGYR